MTNAIKFQWSGSVDPDDKSGVAQYTVADMGGYGVQLRSFQDAHVVHLMLLGAYRAGMRAGQQRMRETVSRAMREAVE